MISLPFRRSPRTATIEAVYGMIVAQARSPEFYRDYGVPDTVAGRFDMIVLHLVLVLRRLRGQGKGLDPLGQQIFDRFCRDMDGNFREMGVGDLVVPRKMREVAEAFYGRAAAYEEALAAPDPAALADAVYRNVYGGAGSPAGAERLAGYVRQSARMLEPEEPAGAGPAGADIRFPRPGEIAA
jgi:cytochrome b pre-mRNA-processing protein 3